MEILIELFLYIVLPIIEFFFEVKIAAPIEQRIRNSRFRKILFQENDSYFLFILKVLLLAAIFILPIIITIILLDKFY